MALEIKGDIQALKLEKGDVLAVSLQQEVTPDQAKRIQDTVQEFLASAGHPGVQVLTMGPGLSLHIIRPQHLWSGLDAARSPDLTHMGSFEAHEPISREFPGGAAYRLKADVSEVLEMVQDLIAEQGKENPVVSMKTDGRTWTRLLRLFQIAETSPATLSGVPIEIAADFIYPGHILVNRKDGSTEWIKLED